MCSNKARIDAACETIVAVAGLDFDQVAKNYFHYYQGTLREAPVNDTSHTFCFNWAAENYPESQRLSVVLACFLSTLLQFRDTCKRSEVPSESIASYQRSRLRQFLGFHRYGDQRLDISKIPLRDDHNPIHSQVRDGSDVRTVLTHRIGHATSRIHVPYLRFGEACPGIAEWLGLPDLSYRKCFAYCVDSKSIALMAKKAVADKREGLSLLQQAALMEQKYLW